MVLEKEQTTSKMLTDALIDLILASDLNIKEIPDDLERAIYEKIFEDIEKYAQEKNLISRMFDACRNIFTHKTS